MKGTLLKLTGEHGGYQLTYHRLVLTHFNQAIAVMEPGESCPYSLTRLVKRDG